MEALREVGLALHPTATSCRVLFLFFHTLLL